MKHLRLLLSVLLLFAASNAMAADCGTTALPGTNCLGPPNLLRIGGTDNTVYAADRAGPPGNYDGFAILNPSTRAVTLFANQYQIYNNNTTALLQASSRIVLTANTTIYVSPTGSNTANTGFSSGSPFLTIQYAINYACNNLDLNAFTLTIDATAFTTNSETLTTCSFLGSNAFSVSSTPVVQLLMTNVTHTGAMYISAGPAWYIKNGTWNNTGAIVFAQQFGSILYLDGVTISNALNAVNNAGGSLFVTGAGISVSGTAYTCFLNLSFFSNLVWNNAVLTLTTTPAWTTGFICGDAGSNTKLFGFTFTGSATGPKYSMTQLSSISPNNANSLLPGSSNGTDAITATTPIAVTTAGAITCTTCITALTSTSPIVVSGSNISCPSCSTTVGQALTVTNDPNVTLTLGGSPTTALIAASSITAGWSGQLTLVRGGTGAAMNVTGGTNFVVQQSSVGAAFTSAQLLNTQILFAGPDNPWTDVGSGTNGCAVAVGDGVTNDAPAIQCQLNFLVNTYGGGVLYFRAGLNYKLAAYTCSGVTCSALCSGSSCPGTLFVSGHTRLVGPAVGETAINTGKGAGSDFTAIIFNATTTPATICGFCSLENIGVVGAQTATGGLSTTATATLIIVQNNALVNFYTVQIQGGGTALSENGIDGTIFNSYIYAGNTTSGAHVISTGANWYVRVKLDNTAAYGFAQNPAFAGASSAENHFIDCDFSGPFSVASIYLNDTNSQSYTIVEGSVMSSGVTVVHQISSMFIGNEIAGALSMNTGNSSLVANTAVPPSTPITASGSTVRTCAANIGITC